tara:strand:- start:571 stop:897 length:327 start_codon:yes stop_codon:yes gene_type:complete
MNWQEKNFYQNTYAVAMDDLVDIWVETFHPFTTLLVIYDASRHFDLLQKCGLLVNSLEAYNNKIVTVELPSILEAFEVMDNLKEEGYHPFMQLYDKGKLLSDNLGPIA